MIKPAIGAGSRDAQRYGREQAVEAAEHIKRLLDGNRSVLMQPYLASVDVAGETALMFFDGVFSHAIRKGALLQRDEGPTRALFAPEKITARTPGADELAVGQVCPGGAARRTARLRARRPDPRGGRLALPARARAHRAVAVLPVRQGRGGPLRGQPEETAGLSRQSPCRRYKRRA